MATLAELSKGKVHFQKYSNGAVWYKHEHAPYSFAFPVPVDSPGFATLLPSYDAKVLAPFINKQLTNPWAASNK